ncbi:uncharacterized protein LOC121715803 [Alosa sapidissima]|uniref:uncharacterized protein LOC121715803 n=1 Tax=Alosa sapidissima TaxID=34773 RepID=UPI001C097345|nr:uncharacterized protein LOC121715803 [Alosa sapidissima]
MILIKLKMNRLNRCREDWMMLSNTRMEDVVITGLKTHHRSYARAVAVNTDGALSSTETDIQNLQGVEAGTTVVVADDPPSTESETLESQVIRFLEGQDVSIRGRQISACHALPQISACHALPQISACHALPQKIKTTYPPAIILRFVNRKDKAKLQGFKLKGSGVYMNEHITKKNGDIAKEARFLRKGNKIKATWTRNGKVLIRTNGATLEEQRAIVVREISELEV